MQIQNLVLHTPRTTSPFLLPLPSVAGLVMGTLLNQMGTQGQNELQEDDWWIDR